MVRLAKAAATIQTF